MNERRCAGDGKATSRSRTRRAGGERLEARGRRRRVQVWAPRAGHGARPVRQPDGEAAASVGRFVRKADSEAAVGLGWIGLARAAPAGCARSTREVVAGDDQRRGPQKVAAPSTEGASWTGAVVKAPSREAR